MSPPSTTHHSGIEEYTYRFPKADAKGKLTGTMNYWWLEIKRRNL